MFCLNEKVVYPGHGVAKINRLITKEISNQKVNFYELVFLNKDVTILVPTNNSQIIGLRALSNQVDIKNAFDRLKMSLNKSNKSESAILNWNKRNKEYQLKLRSGNLINLIEIYKDLKYLSAYKELSFGEKNLLQQTEMLLAEEISIVENISFEKTLEKLRSLCSNNLTNNDINNFAKIKNIEETLI